MACDALADLHQSMLDVAGVLVVGQILRDLLVGKAAAKPAVLPEQKGKQHDKPSGEIEEKTRAGGHAVRRWAGRRAGLRLGSFGQECFRITV